MFFNDRANQFTVNVLQLKRAEMAIFWKDEVEQVALRLHVSGKAILWSINCFVMGSRVQNLFH